jgi:hypothetical protein
VRAPFSVRPDGADRLVGQDVVCQGTLHQGTVIVQSWEPCR